MKRGAHDEPVLEPTEARQGRRRGVIWILIISLALALVAWAVTHFLYAPS